MITVTEKAAKEVQRLLAADATAGKDSYLRVMVVGGGCSGMSYKLGFESKAPEASDKTFEDKGVKVFVDPKAVLFLLGTEMDYETNKLSSQFVFRNPNQTSACGCGESVAITPASPPRPEARGAV